MVLMILCMVKSGYVSSVHIAQKQEIAVGDELLYTNVALNNRIYIFNNFEHVSFKYFKIYFIFSMDIISIVN